MCVVSILDPPPAISLLKHMHRYIHACIYKRSKKTKTRNKGEEEGEGRRRIEEKTNGKIKKIRPALGSKNATVPSSEPDTRMVVVFVVDDVDSPTAAAAAAPSSPLLAKHARQVTPFVWPSIVC